MTGLSSRELKLLSELALSAAVQGYGREAKPIFDALRVLKPENAIAAIGSGLTEMIDGNFAEAARILQREGITAAAGGTEAKALLAIALMMSGRIGDALQLQQELMRTGPGPAKQIAELLLEKLRVHA